MSPARRGPIGLCRCQRLKQLPGFRPGEARQGWRSPLCPHPRSFTSGAAPSTGPRSPRAAWRGTAPFQDGEMMMSQREAVFLFNSGPSSLQWGCGHRPVDLSSRTIDTESLAGRASLGQGSESAHGTPTGHVAAPPTCTAALSLLFRTPDFSGPECPRLVSPPLCVPMASCPHS